MSGTIVFGEGADWSVSSGVFNWVINYLADTVDDELTRDELRLIDEQNFRWLNLSDLSETGRQQVLSILRQDIEPYAREKLPPTELREDTVAKIGELGELARSSRA
jgi:hypothetical protein